MNRKQFITLVVVLVVLLGAGAWVQWSDQLNWNKTDTMAGKKLLPTLTAVSVAEISLRGPQGQVHLVKKGADWIIPERADFKADVPRIVDLLSKVVELRIIQTEKVASDKRGDFDLISPAAAAVPAAPAAAPDASATSATPAVSPAAPVAGSAAPVASAAAGQGTVMELKDAGGKTLASLLLGKTLYRKGMIPSNDGSPPKEGDVPYGRYVISGGDTVTVMNEPLDAAAATPAPWLAKDVFRIDPAQSITSIGPDGKERWTLTKANGLWGWPLGDKPDPQKAQDVVSSLYLVQLTDVVTDPAKVNTGLDHPVTLRAVTPIGITYTVKIGNKADDNSYYMSYAMAGDPVKTRPAVPGEKPEDKAKNDKEYVDQFPKLVEQINAERDRTKWTYKMPKYPAEQVIHTREQLLPEKKPEPAFQGPG